MVLSIADDAIDNDLEIMAENIFPITRIYENKLVEKFITKKKSYLTMLEKSVVLISISVHRLSRSIRSSCDVPDACRSCMSEY